MSEIPDSHITLTAEEQAIADEFLAKYGREALPEYIWSRHYQETIKQDVQCAVEILKYFVSKGCPIDAHGGGINGTALHCASYCSPHVAVLQYLVSQGADVNADDGYGYLPLHFAAQYATSSDVIEYLVSQGADVNAKGSRVMKPVQIASWFNRDVEIAECFITLGADADEGVLQRIEKKRQASAEAVAG